MMKVMFVTSNLFPVPNVRGGAIETLITDFIQINEKEQLCDVVVAGRYDAAAEQQSRIFQHTSFLFYDAINDNKAVTLWRILRYRFFGLFHHAVPKYMYQEQIVRYLDDNPVDFIIVEEGDCYSFDYFSKKYGKDKIIAHTHSSWPANEKYHSIYKYGIVPSSYTLKTLIDGRWEEYWKTFAVVSNCINEEQFNNSYSPEQIHQMRQKLNIPDHAYVMMFAGRINKDKGVKELILAMDQLPDCVLLLVGSALMSHSTNDAYEQEIKKMIEQRTNIIQTGYVDYSRIQEYYAAADVLVSPGYAGDSCCMVNLEAMMMGLPIITSNNGGIPEYVKEGRNGFLIDIHNISNEIVKNVKYLQSHPNAVSNMHQANLEDSRNYQRSTYYHSMIAVLEKWLQERSI